MKGVNALVRLAYKLAYPIWCWLLRVSGHRLFGALVMIWYDGRLLMLRTSYHDETVLPGGQAKRGEDSRDTAVREVAEELGLQLDPQSLKFACEVNFDIRGLRGTDHIYTIEFAQCPELRLDQREIVSADWLLPEQAHDLIVEPEIRELLIRR